MNIDSKAPLIAKREQIINAPIKTVWQIQTDIDNWPKWQKDVTSAKLQGRLEAGSVFIWKAMGMNIVSKLQEVVINKTIGWSGKSFGMQAIHYWYFEDQGNVTKVTTEESLSGWFPMLIKMFKPNFLEESLATSLQTLKSYAENQKLDVVEMK